MNFELPSQRSIATKIIQIKILIRPFPSFLTTSCASYSSLSRSLSIFPYIHCTSSMQHSSSLKLSLRLSLRNSIFSSLITTHPDVALLVLSLSCDLLVVSFVFLTLTYPKSASSSWRCPCNLPDWDPCPYFPLVSTILRRHSRPGLSWVIRMSSWLVVFPCDDYYIRPTDKLCYMQLQII